MVKVFSTRNEPTILCTDPVITIGFPRCPTACPGPNTVTLANGAVVDLVELGRIVGQLCPSIFCQPVPITAATLPATAVSPLTMATTPATVGSEMDP